MNNTKTKQNRKSLFSSSLIVRGVDAFATSAYEKLRFGVFGRFFSGYASVEKAFSESASAGLAKRASEKLAKPVHNLKYKFDSRINTSLLFGLCKNIISSIINLPLHIFSVFLITYAIYSAGVSFIRLFGYHDISLFGALFMPSLCALAGIVLAPSKQPLCKALRESALFSFILFDFMNLRRDLFNTDLPEEREAPRRKSFARNTAFIIGMVLGVLSFFTGTLLPVIALCALPAGYLVLVSPEAGLLLALFGLPFLTALSHPTIMLSFFVIFITLSTLVKWARGKREISFRFADVLILVFALLLLFGGLVSQSSSSLYPTMIFLSLILGYFLIVNLFSTREHIEKAGMTLVASAGIVAAYGIFQQITGTASSVWLDTEMFSDISGRVVSTFENPNMLGNYLIMIIPICAAFLFSSKSSRGVVSFGIPLMLMLFCLVFTWARGAWLGLIFAAFVFIFIMGRHAVTLTALGIIAIPFLPFVLPDSILNRFMSIGNLGDSSTSYRVYIWRGSLNMARDFFTGGIGVGEGAFREVYPYYSLSGIEAAPHSHNLFLQIMIELGFLGLVLFTFICVFLVLGVFTKIKGTLSVRVKLVAGGCLCGTLAALAQGMTDYIWYNYRVFFIFWALIGLSCAIMRLNTEKDYTGKISQNGKFAYDLEI